MITGGSVDTSKLTTSPIYSPLEDVTLYQPPLLELRNLMNADIRLFPVLSMTSRKSSSSFASVLKDDCGGLKTERTSTLDSASMIGRYIYSSCVALKCWPSSVCKSWLEY